MKKQEKKKIYLTGKSKIKFVKAAGAWAKTSYVEGKQKIEWFKDKPL